MRLLFDVAQAITLRVDALAGTVEVSAQPAGQPGRLLLRTREGGAVMGFAQRGWLDCGSFSAEMLVRVVQALRRCPRLRRLEVEWCESDGRGVVLDVMDAHLQTLLQHRWGLSPAQALLLVRRAGGGNQIQPGRDADALHTLGS